MNTIAISKLKQMKVAEIKEALPMEITSDGDVIGYLQVEASVIHEIKEVPKPETRQTKCPNCKFVYTVTEPDGKPPFFTMRHPKE
jgi:hypothetical protein